MVGAAGFEPATPWSQTRCATRLRYAPSLARRLTTPKVALLQDAKVHLFQLLLPNLNNACFQTKGKQFC